MYNILILTRNTVYRLLSFFDQLLHREKNIVVLCYHAINENSRFSTKLSDFKKQINIISKTHKPVSLTELIEKLQSNELDANMFVVTFDDGYKSILKTQKFLQSKKITPTVSLISDTKNAQLTESDLYLSKSDIRQLKRSGWEFASHTATHRKLIELTKAELTSELSNSRNNMDVITYPLGRYNESVIKFSKKVGFKYGLTMDDGVITNKTDLMKIPRVGVDATHSVALFRSIYSPSVVSLRAVLKNSVFKSLFINI